MTIKKVTKNNYIKKDQNKQNKSRKSERRCHKEEAKKARYKKSQKTTREKSGKTKTEEKAIKSFSENVLLAYFGKLADKYKPSSLWSRYAMLKSTLNINYNVSIESYPKLRALLKRKSDNYYAKKARTFSVDNITQFIAKAPDEIYLATKVNHPPF